MSKMISLHLYCTHMFTTDLLSKYFIMWSTSQVWKQNCLLLGAGLTKPLISVIFQKSLLSPALFMQLKEFLILLPFQVHAAAILKELWSFFSYHQDNSIKFWEYPSQSNWVLHKAIDKEMKSFNPTPLFLYKMS